MPMINLLPWREELRQKRKKEFLMSALGAVLMAAAVTLGTKAVFQAKIASQESRNEMLRTEITELDLVIAAINDLDTRKRRLLERMEIIDELERTTPETVTLVDSLVDILPEGTYLTGVNQRGTQVNLSGRVQSYQRVSDLMRSVERSPWLTNPQLDAVNTQGQGAQSFGQFTLAISQVRISENEEALP